MLGVVLTIIVASMLLIVIGAVARVAFWHFLAHPVFGAFLCHHKESSASLARYSKQHM